MLHLELDISIFFYDMQNMFFSIIQVTHATNT